MLTALSLFAVQGVIGAFDTLYYHEYRARLPAGLPATAPELRVHAIRDFLYAVLFGSLPWIAWQGGWTIVLGVVILAEIALTMTDFVIEITARKSIGDVFGGERVTHAVMAILYGAMIANLLPVMADWWSQPTALAYEPAPIPDWLRGALTLMAVGVFTSGLRDLYASLGGPGAAWPWRGKPEGNG